MVEVVNQTTTVDSYSLSIHVKTISFFSVKSYKKIRSVHTFCFTTRFWIYENTGFPKHKSIF